MEQETIYLIGGIGLFAIFIWQVIGIMEEESVLSDGPGEIIDRKEIRNHSKLTRHADEYLVTVFGQAGKVKSEEYYTDVSFALGRAAKAFSRVEDVKVTRNDTGMYVIRRNGWNHRGRKEGHVVGLVTIEAAPPVEAEQPVNINNPEVYKRRNRIVQRELGQWVGDSMFSFSPSLADYETDETLFVGNIEAVAASKESNTSAIQLKCWDTGKTRWVESDEFRNLVDERELAVQTHGVQSLTEAIQKRMDAKL